MKRFDLAVIGGGAAGFFGAIACAETHLGSRIVILEKAPEVLGKVKISGGGRCNVTHDCHDPKELVQRYPRGGRSLIGPFHRFAPGDTIDWFAKHGVELKVESDGRMFPSTDRSQTVIDALESAATRWGIDVWTRTEVTEVEKLDDGGFRLTFGKAPPIEATQVLVTSGGVRSGIGAAIAEQFGHTVHEAAPSLFTFKIPNDTRLRDLSGLSVANARVHVPSIPQKTLGAETGPVLITHWGLSGPAILRLSAWGARELQAMDYDFAVEIDWTANGREAAQSELARLRDVSPRKQITNTPGFDIPTRLWERLIDAAGIPSDRQWAQVTKAEQQALLKQLTACTCRVTGKSMNKDEFVTCGGIDLREVDFKTMQSKKVEGLHFAGEVLDIDGVTGGFNFQAAWTTGRIAGESCG